MLNKTVLEQWQPPTDWQQILTFDAHTGGEPLRIVMQGFPALPGDSMLAKRRYCLEHCDELRKTIMWEPRGHADMYGCIITEPTSEDGDLGVLFTHNEGYSSMCGHGIIALATVLVQTGALPFRLGETCIAIDTPAGRVAAVVQSSEDSGQRVVDRVYFHNVPSFVEELDAAVNVTGLGDVQYDLAFGGAYYAYVDAPTLGLRVVPEQVNELIEAGRRIKDAVINSRTIVHPVEADLGFLYGVVFVEPLGDRGKHSRNVCIFADGEVDRSPTGTGVSGRAAISFQRGELRVNECLRIESIIGSVFNAGVHATLDYHGYQAIVPRVEGRAHITGTHRFMIDPADSLRHGFLLR